MAKHILGPVPPPPTPVVENGGFSSSVWQRWFSQLGLFVRAYTIGGTTGAYSTPTRVVGTVYTSSKASIFVSVVVSLAPSAATALTIGGVVAAYEQNGGTSTALMTVQGIVPPNTSYEITTAGTATLSNWLEYS
jgi:hypothetical protein